MKKKLSFFCLFLLAMMSCRKDIVLSDRPENVFRSFWKIMNENYPYFEEKGIDWDSVYSTCYTRAKNTRLKEDLLNIFEEILEMVKDKQLRIECGRYFDGMGISYDPPYYSVIPVDWDNEGNGFSRTYYHYQILQDTTKKYVYYDILFFYEGNIKAFDNVVNSNNYRNGIILDIRNNYSPGYGVYGVISYDKMIDEMIQFVSIFFADEITAYYESHQNGKGTSNFSTKRPKTISGRGWISDNLPVIVLVSQYTNLTATLFTQIMKRLPNCIVIGEKTSGCSIGDTQITILPNSWRLLCPINITKRYDLDGKNIDFGVEPDIYARQIYHSDKDTATNRKDSTLIKAIQVLDSINGF
ncbi:MAG: hypothetical protein LBT04_07300 [Prevotellaceae bacterium]|jgi:hypothetical protein|nr:hypothetical protein [Prevotellaceae bacterium]